MQNIIIWKLKILLQTIETMSYTTIDSVERVPTFKNQECKFCCYYFN